MFPFSKIIFPNNSTQKHEIDMSVTNTFQISDSSHFAHSFHSKAFAITRSEMVLDLLSCIEWLWILFGCCSTTWKNFRKIKLNQAKNEETETDRIMVKLKTKLKKEEKNYKEIYK